MDLLFQQFLCVSSGDCVPTRATSPTIKCLGLCLCARIFRFLFPPSELKDKIKIYFALSKRLMVVQRIWSSSDADVLPNGVRIKAVIKELGRESMWATHAPGTSGPKNPCPAAPPFKSGKGGGEIL